MGVSICRGAVGMVRVNICKVPGAAPAGGWQDLANPKVYGTLARWLFAQRMQSNKGRCKLGAVGWSV